MPIPLSAQELCEAVRQSLPFDPSRLDRVLRVDTARAVVEVQSATTWKSLAARLRPGDAQAAQLRTTCPTIGESIAWNAAGPDGRPTVTHVESFTLVTPDGQLRRIDRAGSPQLFALTVGGQGLFGTVYSITLRLDSLARAVNEAGGCETLVQPASRVRSLQLLVPPERLAALIGDARSRCEEWRMPVQGLQVRRIRPEQETFLRWASRDYAEVGIAVGEGTTLGGRVRATQLRRELIDLAISHGGTFPIACTPEATRAQTQACYPQIGDFLAEHRRIDPHERWGNGWLRHHRSLLAREACEVRWGRYAEP